MAMPRLFLSSWIFSLSSINVFVTSILIVTADNWDACGGRLERALDVLNRESGKRRLDEEDAIVATYQQDLSSAPLEMIVKRITVKLPRNPRVPTKSWAQVERCLYEPRNNSLLTRVILNDLSVSGLIALTPFNKRPIPNSIPVESCRMTLRLRRAGIEFLTGPIARGRGQMRIRTESSFLEPRFASIYAYGCQMTKRYDKQIKRQDKWPPNTQPPPYYSPTDKLMMVPWSSNPGNYEGPEPREVDGNIPDETLSSRLYASATEVTVTTVPVTQRPDNNRWSTSGIWRDSEWITKSFLSRKRRSIDKKGKYKKFIEFLDKKGELSKSNRLRRSIRIITPEDFTLALGRNNSIKNNNTTIEMNNSSVVEDFNESVDNVKINFKRENYSHNPSGRDYDDEDGLFIDDNLNTDIFDDYTDKGDGRSWQSKEDVAREMEDVFLKGASRALTRYIERQLHPAIKETLMVSMGYTISYG